MKKNRNRLGMSALISHPEKPDIEEQLQIFASVGFESFFLSTGVTDEFEKIPYWSRCAKNVGIDFEAIHAPSALVDLVWNEKEQAVDYQKNCENLLDLCSEGEISKLVLHVGTSPNTSITQKGLSFWNALERYAQKRGVILCYENANTPLLFEAVVENMDSFHGICFDIGHQLCYTPEKDYATLYGNKILYTHIHDNLADGCDSHLLPKDGINDWDCFFEKLNNMGYTGTLNLELSCYHKKAYTELSFYEFAKHSYARLYELTK